MSNYNEEWKTNPPEWLKLVAVELRLMGVREELVRHYLYCGDNSVETMKHSLEDGTYDAEHYNTTHYHSLKRRGEIE